MGCKLPECCLYTFIQLSKDVRKIIVKTGNLSEPKGCQEPRFSLLISRNATRSSL